MIKDEYAIEITNVDFEIGSLMKESNIRINKIFTAHRSIVVYKIGSVKDCKTCEIVDGVIKLLSRSEK